MESKINELEIKNTEPKQTKQRVKKMKPENCHKFDVCNAPICPLDPEMENYIWYPDEEICRAQKYNQNLEWINTQRKISKRAKNADTYYTLKMLNRNFIVKTGIEGLDPNIIEGKTEELLKKNEEKYENEWIEKHPVISEDTLEKRSDIMKKMWDDKK